MPPCVTVGPSSTTSARRPGINDGSSTCTGEAASMMTALGFVRASVARANPKAVIIEAASPVQVDDPSLIPGRRALVVEDGPTVTHGGIAYGRGRAESRRG